MLSPGSSKIFVLLFCSPVLNADSKVYGYDTLALTNFTHITDSQHLIKTLPTGRKLVLSST